MELLDPYTLKMLEKNGWYAGRRFRESDFWIAEIEARGYPSFAYARQIVRELGGLSFHEYAPLTYRKMTELRRKEGREIPPDFAADIKAACENSLNILNEYHLADQAETYSGATFAFDALSAARDDEIILDREIIENVAGEPLFPIGTVAPDGISFVRRDGKIYTAFHDSIYLSGENIERYCNAMFIKSLKPVRLYPAGSESNA